MSRDDHLQKGADVSAYRSIIAGSFSGAVARAFTAPLDTVKIRLQLQTSKLNQYNGAYSTFKNILKYEGVTGLWKGNVPAEVMYILYGAVQFTSYSVFNKTLTTIQKDHQLTLNKSTHSLVVGTCAGLTSTIFTYPFDLLRTRLAANSSKELLSMMKTVRNILEKEGPVGFFLGIRPAVVSVASNSGLMFWTYETAREYSRRYKDIPFIEGICGFTAGATAKGITFPLDTIRKRIQMHKVTNGSSVWQVTSGILRHEGIFGLYKGFGISVLKTAPTSAISIFMYEYVLSMI